MSKLMRVDFYLLESNQPIDGWLYTCRLLEKAYSQGHRIFVYCDNEEEANLIDELLWTYKDESFIPHNIQGEGPLPPPAVQIGFTGEPSGFNDILINMARTIPPFYTRFRRILEIVTADEVAKNISRDHFRTYRKQGFELFTHNPKL